MMMSPTTALNSGRSSGRTLQVSDELLNLAERTTRGAAEYLLGLQKDDGHWCALLTADTTLESDYILMQLWLHPPVNGVWNPPTRSRVERAIHAIFDRQLDDGGFSIYLHGPSEVSACIKAYFALKVAGVLASDPRMLRLRTRILE